MEQKNVNLPKKGSGRRLAERLKQLGQQKPPQSIVDKINNGTPAPALISQNETKVRFEKTTLFVAFYKCFCLQKTTFNGTF